MDELLPEENRIPAAQGSNPVTPVREKNKAHQDKKPPETRHEKFTRLAEARVNNIIDKMRILGHLADTRFYDYDEDDVRIMFTAIEKELRKTRAMFSHRQKNAKRFAFNQGKDASNKGGDR